ncbi:MAG: G5 domain-containing protein [Clostridiales bacterium]|nr:G5 domain-containing protein [Clostridiales bacterium]
MGPFWRNIRKHISIDGLSVFTSMILLVVAITVTGFYAEREITILDNDKVTKVSTKIKTVGELMDDIGLKLGEYDVLDFDSSTKLRKLPEGKIKITRALPVLIKVDGNSHALMTTKATIKEVLEEDNVKLEQFDFVRGHSLNDCITEGINIDLVRVTKKEEVKMEKVPFKSRKKENINLDRLISRVIQKGVPGEREITYQITYHDGKEVSRDIEKNVITKKPVDEITEVGTSPRKEISRGRSFRYKKMIPMKASAYTASYEETGKRPGTKGYGITASGMKAERGVVAVDPRVIPLGTRLYIETVGRGPDYGFAIAADTGGAIKGNVVDLFYENKVDALNWGRRNVRVYILD